MGDPWADASRWRPNVGQLVWAAALTALVVFAAWEGFERHIVDEATRVRLHYVRGGLASVLTALVVSLVAQMQYARHARALAHVLADQTRQAQDSQTLLQVVVDNTPSGLMILDRQLTIVRANRAAERLHGGPLAGTPCFVAMAGGSPRCASCAALTTGDGAQASCDNAVHTDPRTGEVTSVEAHPLRLPGGREYTLLVEHVLTEQKKLQVRLLHQEKMAAFGLLAAGVAHDLGNPLASIEIQLQLLDEARFDAQDRAIIATVRHETGRLRRILREMVDFARRRRDEAALVSVQAVVQDALRLMRHDPRLRRVQVVEEFDPDTAPVFVVEDHLMQVALNLVINAVDAMPEGGALRVELMTILDEVVLRVHDTGHGMDRHVLAHCFEPLFTTKAPGRGTGLGLSVSRDIVRAAGGDIELHSAPQQGTTVVVRLPAASADPVTAACERPARPASEAAGP